MKKKLSLACLALVGSISLGTLASCNSSKVPTLEEKDGVVITYNGVEYTINQSYDEFDGSVEQAKAFYDALNDIFIQIATPRTSLIDSEVNEKVDNFYKTAKDAAKTNGTSEKEEIEKAFETEGVDSEQELRQKYTLDAKKTQNGKDFEQDTNILKYRSDYFQNKAPYVTKHILAKVDASSSNLYDGKISKDNAHKISNIILGLASNETYPNFGEVAQRLSDDGSAANYGVIKEPMELTTSFVNEYKLGIYAQDYLFNTKNVKDGYTKDRTNLVNMTNMPVNSEDPEGTFDVEHIIGNKNTRDKDDGLISEASAFGIPFSAALDLQKYADTDKSSSGTTVTDASEVNYPRNIIFNHYFNNHAISYVYLDEEDSDTQKWLESHTSNHNFHVKDINLIQYVDDTTAHSMVSSQAVDTTTTTGIQNLGKDKKILCDENGNPILVARAGTGSSTSTQAETGTDGSSDGSEGGEGGSSGYEGIHFIVNQFNPFSSVDNKVDNPKSGGVYDYTDVIKDGKDNAEKVQLIRNDYFNLTIPSSNQDDKKVYNPSLITSISSSESKYYNEMADAVRTALKGAYGSNLDYKKFDVNRNKSKELGATVNADVEKIVNDYIKAIIEDNNFTNTRNLATAWEAYFNLVDLQKSLSNRILPTKCIAEFESGTINKGGVCHVA